MLGAVELKGRGLVDRHGDRAGGRVGAVAGVEHNGFRIHGCGHDTRSAN